MKALPFVFLLLVCACSPKPEQQQSPPVAAVVKTVTLNADCLRCVKDSARLVSRWVFIRDSAVSDFLHHGFTKDMADAIGGKVWSDTINKEMARWHDSIQRFR